MINSRMKGKVGELELAQFLRSRGFTNAARGQQFKGGSESPDVAGLPGYHIECKRVESGNLYNWIDQSIRDSDGLSIPIVCHRKNRRDWITILRLEDFLDLVKRASPNAVCTNEPIESG